MLLSSSWGNAHTYELNQSNLKQLFTYIYRSCTQPYIHNKKLCLCLQKKNNNLMPQDCAEALKNKHNVAGYRC